MSSRLPAFPRVTASSTITTKMAAAKLLPPPPHMQQVRRLMQFVYVPTEKTYFYGEVTSFLPGHVELVVRGKSMQALVALKNKPLGLDAAFGVGKWPASLAISHAANSGGLIHRSWRVTSSDGVEYNNVQVAPYPWFMPRIDPKKPQAVTIDLGEMTEGMWNAISYMLNDQLRSTYALGGPTRPPPQHLWTPEEVKTLFETGVMPQGADHCISFLARVIVALAEYLAPGSNTVLRLKKALGECTQPEQMADVVATYFKPNANHAMTLVTPPAKVQTSAEDTEEQELQAMLYGVKTDAQLAAEKNDRLAATQRELRAKAAKLTNYGEFAQVFGGDGQLFATIAAQLIGDGSIFELIFTEKRSQDWGKDFFGRLGKQLSGESISGVAAVMYHKNTYGPVTHVSSIGFSREGRVSICHHESINKVQGKTRMEDGLALDTVGIASASYNTLDAFGEIAKHFKLGETKWDDLPIVQSYKKTGPPMVKFTPLEDFKGFEDFNNRCHNEARTQIGLDTHYGVDPNQALSELSVGLRSGKVTLTLQQAKLLMSERRFALHPKFPPPGATGPFLIGEATNNCGRQVLLGLMAGKATVLKGATYSPEYDLADVADILYRAGLLVNTDPRTIELMRKGGYVYEAKTQRILRHPLAFLKLGVVGWSDAPAGRAGVYKPDVDRIKPADVAKAEAELEATWKLQEEIAEKNAATFLPANFVPPKSLINPPISAPVQQLGEADWPAIKAHVMALSVDDRGFRFTSTDPEQVVASLQRSGHRFAAVRDPKTHEILMLLQLNLFLRNDGLNLETGISVVASQRRHGWGVFGLKWACAWARNRGALMLYGQHAATNTAGASTLKDLGAVEYTDTSGAYHEFQVSLAPADADSHWLENFGQPIKK
ncbi:MAG: hypothetical protein V4794_04880 [Pseudomonadota bacterium]